MRSFRYDLNQILYDYRVEVMNRFKGSDLVHRVPNELCTEVCNTVQEAVKYNKHIPKKNKCKKAKLLPEEALQLAKEKKKNKSKGYRERYTQLNAEFQRIARRDKKANLNE